MCLERSIKLLILIITVGSPVQYHTTGELFGFSVQKVKKKRMPLEPPEYISRLFRTESDKTYLP